MLTVALHRRQFHQPQPPPCFTVAALSCRQQIQDVRAVLYVHSVIPKLLQLGLREVCGYVFLSSSHKHAFYVLF